MKLPGAKHSEKFIKDLISYSQLGKLAHQIKSINRPNAVFIWIPKNAGTSMYLALRKHGCIKAKEISRVKHRFSQKGLVTFSHMDYHQLVAEGYVSQKFDKTSYKFCFSRNPYDRAISLYSYLIKKQSPKPSFLDFWTEVRDNPIDEIGLYNTKGLSQCNPQVRWIENIKIDYLGKYETISDDIEKIMAELGLPKINLGHHNKSKRKNLCDYYCPKSKQIVEEIYSEDFKFFDYPLSSYASFNSK